MDPSLGPVSIWMLTVVRAHPNWPTQAETQVRPQQDGCGRRKTKNNFGGVLLKLKLDSSPSQAIEMRMGTVSTLYACMYYVGNRWCLCGLVVLGKCCREKPILTCALNTPPGKWACLVWGSQLKGGVVWDIKH